MNFLIILINSWIKSQIKRIFKLFPKLNIFVLKKKVDITIIDIGLPTTIIQLKWLKLKKKRCRKLWQSFNQRRLNGLISIWPKKQIIFQLCVGISQDTMTHSNLRLMKSSKEKAASTKFTDLQPLFQLNHTLPKWKQSYWTLGSYIKKITFSFVWPIKPKAKRTEALL
jgi:hypothetical protein